MTRSRSRRTLPPLDEGKLNELALRYVERFATTRVKLRRYLARKVTERGWKGDHEPDLTAIAERFANQGYVDDAAYALSKSQSLSNRGYGKRRLIDSLRAAGIDENDTIEARELADFAAVDSALRFAKKRRYGPFACSEQDSRAQQRAIGAMVRAGHDFALVRAILQLGPGHPIDLHDLAEHVRLTDM